eukprot:2204031-Rhodomonas_salina.2
MGAEQGEEQVVAARASRQGRHVRRGRCMRWHAQMKEEQEVTAGRRVHRLRRRSEQWLQPEGRPVEGVMCIEGVVCISMHQGVSSEGKGVVCISAGCGASSGCKGITSRASCASRASCDSACIDGVGARGDGKGVGCIGAGAGASSGRA